MRVQRLLCLALHSRVQRVSGMHLLCVCAGQQKTAAPTYTQANTHKHICRDVALAALTQACMH